jgi:uncharacterized protein YndB with AHSA1/START domain
MSTSTDTTTTQVYRVYIKATPEAVWDAITKPEWTDRYGYGGFPEYDDGLSAGSQYRILAGTGMQQHGVTGPVVDGELVEVDPPRRFTQTWRMLMDPGLQAEGFTRLTYELEETGDGVTKLTVTHDLTGAPGLAAMVSGQGEASGAGGGWAWILSDLKSLVETGAPLAG